MILFNGLVLAGAGTVVGIAGSLVLSRVIAKMLYGVRATDPATFGGVVLVLAGAALLATLIPARKALNIEPMTALRHE